MKKIELIIFLFTVIILQIMAAMGIYLYAMNGLIIYGIASIIILCVNIFALIMFYLSTKDY